MNSLFGPASDFLHREALLLDDGRLEEWLDLFDDDGIYWIPARDGTIDPDREVSIVYDDKRRLIARVSRLLSGKEYAQNPKSVTCHQLSNIVIDDDRDDGLVVVAAVQVVYETRPNTGLQIIPARVRWRLRPHERHFAIAEKRVDLIDINRYFENLTFML